MKNLILLSLFIFLQSFLFAQQIRHSLGISLSISISSLKKNAGASISLSYGIFRVPGKKEAFKVLPAYQLSINGYLNGIASRYDSNEFFIDFHNSILLTAFSDKFKFRTIDIQPEFHYLEHSYPKSINSIPLKSSTSLTVSSNYIFNFRNRRQLYGSIMGQIGKFRIQHYNDGGIIMGNLKIGDDHDRWWTGGTFIEYGTDIQFDSIAKLQSFPRKIRFSFHRFTWNNQKEFEIASRDSLEFIPVTPANQEQAKYNFGKYALTLFWNQFAVDFEANNKFKDLQDILHEKGKSAKHPTIAPAYYSIQISKQNLFELRD